MDLFGNPIGSRTSLAFFRAKAGQSGLKPCKNAFLRRFPLPPKRGFHPRVPPPMLANRRPPNSPRVAYKAGLCNGCLDQAGARRRGIAPRNRNITVRKPKFSSQLRYRGDELAGCRPVFGPSARYTVADDSVTVTDLPTRAGRYGAEPRMGGSGKRRRCLERGGLAPIGKIDFLEVADLRS